jgi:hypothetical protein
VSAVRDETVLPWAKPGFARREPNCASWPAGDEGGGSWGNYGFPHAQKEG